MVIIEKCNQAALNGEFPSDVRLPEPNAETIAAMQEALDISSGKIPSKKFYSVDALMDDLLNDADD